MRLAETLIVAVIVAVLIIMQIKALKTVMDNKVTPIVEAAEEYNSKMDELQDLLDGRLYD